MVIGIFLVIDAVAAELAHAPGPDDTPESRRALEEQHDKDQIVNLRWEIGIGIATLGIGNFILKPVFKKFFCRSCFVAGTAVATQLGVLPIESVEVGDVVISAPDTLEDGGEEWSTNHDLEESADPNSWEQIDPDQWSLVEMRVDFDGGVYTYIKALRPNAWVDGLKAGDRVDYYREGVGVVGDIEILSISDCPDLPTNTVGVVRATYETHGVRAVDLWLSGSDQPLGVTLNHLLYSLDREAWVEVGNMWVGERLRTIDGKNSIAERITLRDGKEVVYNFEVHGDYTYYVGNRGVWAHNGGVDYPPHSGFNPDMPVGPTSLPPGTRLDRYGNPGGRYVTTPGTPHNKLALPPGTNTNYITRYTVLKPIPAIDGTVRAWDFGVGEGVRPGGGRQFLLTENLDDLRSMGFVK